MNSVILRGFLAVCPFVERFLGRFVVQPGVEPFRVVPELDIAGDVRSRVCAGWVRGSVNAFVLQCREERLGHRVIIADSGSSYRLAQSEFTDGAGELIGGVIA